MQVAVAGVREREAFLETKRKLGTKALNPPPSEGSAPQGEGRQPKGEGKGRKGKDKEKEKEKSNDGK